MAIILYRRKAKGYLNHTWWRGDKPEGPKDAPKAPPTSHDPPANEYSS
jgi:hypothetical protein